MLDISKWGFWNEKYFERRVGEMSAAFWGLGVRDRSKSTLARQLLLIISKAVIIIINC